MGLCGYLLVPDLPSEVHCLQRPCTFQTTRNSHKRQLIQRFVHDPRHSPPMHGSEHGGANQVCQGTRQRRDQAQPAEHPTSRRQQSQGHQRIHATQQKRRVFAHVVGAGVCRGIEQPDDPLPDKQQGHLVISSCGHQLAVDDPLALVATAVADPQLSTFRADRALMPAHRFVDVPMHLDDGAGIGGESPHGCSPVVSIQAPMRSMPVKRHRQWRRMPGHCVGTARLPVDRCCPWGVN